MIQGLGPTHTEAIMALIGNCVRSMQVQGLDQWDEIYPDLDTIKRDISENSAFGYFVDGELGAYIVLNEEQSPEYHSVPWQSDTGNFLVIHRLCVDPRFQGRGLAKQMMGFAQDYAKTHNYDSIRFDAFLKNQVSLRLYDGLGFTRAGFVKFRKGDFVCYEKLRQDF